MTVYFNNTIIKRTKKVTKITIHSFVLELQTLIDFTPAQIKVAEESRIDTKNGPYFAYLVRGYKKGIYDEDMDVLGDLIKLLLRKN